jgi:serine phosphatase RsbU (regulator of sigma subunit)
MIARGVCGILSFERKGPTMPQYLIIRGADGSTKNHELTGDSVGLGRSKSNAISHSEDAGLSRNHLVFEHRADGWAVRDLKSKNGTRVNGTPLGEDESRKLKHGDRVTAGHMLLEYVTSLEDRNRQTVVFIPGDEVTPAPTTAVVVTNLEGALAAKISTSSASTFSQAPGPELVAERQMRALIRAGRELAGHLSLDELFEVILGLSIEAVSARRGVLMTLENGELQVKANRGEGFRISGAVRDRVLKDKASLLVRDVLLDDAFRNRDSIMAQNVRRFMAVPLQTNATVIGLIYVDASDIMGEFMAEDLNLLTVMANVAAIRIEHARLAEVEAAEKVMARELEQAAEIQRQLLPAAAPRAEGLELAGYNAACRGVGGDYYHFHHYENGRVALIVGDVAGKGMPAALLMSNLQATVQVLLEELQGVADTVSRLNRLIAGSCPGNRFITFFLGVIDPKREEIVYCNAGHNPPMVVRADGSVEMLGGGGLILGVLARAKYEEKRCRLEPGDVVMLFSDGVTEATPPDLREEFGEDRLSALLAKNRNCPAEMIIDRVRTAVAEWIAGAPPADDITLVVARRVA